MKENRKNRVQRNGKRQGKRVLAGLLCLFIALSLAPRAHAADTDRKQGETAAQYAKRDQSILPKTAGTNSVSNAYVLQVITGSSTTDAILYFCVRYEDESGISRMEYIFPGEDYGELGAGYEKAAQRIRAIRKNAGSDTLTTAECELAEVKRWGYSLSGYQEKTALQPLEKNEFYFEPRYTLKKINSIDIMCRYGENEKLSWPCQSMAIYRVDELYDLMMVGHFSDQYYLEYKGTCVALMVPYNSNGFSGDLGYSFAWGTSDTLFRVEARDAGDRSTQKAYELVTDLNNDTYRSFLNYDTCDKDRYLMKLDIADEYGAGVEALATAYGTRGVNSWEKLDQSSFDFSGAADYADSSRKRSGWMYQQGFCEVMAVEITYTDIYGITCSVSVPAVLSFLDWALTFGTFDCTMQIFGLLQQGESLAFDTFLPHCAAVKEVRLRFGSAGAKSSVGLSGSTAQESGMTKESMSITGMTIYEYNIFGNVSAELTGGNTGEAAASETTTEGVVYPVTEENGGSAGSYAYAAVEGGFIRIRNAGEPLYYYTCSSAYGQALTQSSSAADQNYFKVPLSAYTGKESLEPRAGSDRYLIVLETDTMEAAGTTSDFRIKMHYHSIDGQDKSTESVSIKTAVQSYAGYWPGLNGEASYTYSASAGNSLYYVLSAKNVSYFTGMTISMEHNSDDYQLAGIRIYELTNLGKRNGRWENATSPSGNVITDRVFTREFNTDREISPTLQEPVLFQSNETKTITFVSGGTTKTEEEDVDWSSIQYSMTYSEAMQNLGFTKQRQAYTVKVQVSDMVVNGEVNEDCGSKNHFYFRLLFENGSSGYVLANQQLGADGFRTGTTESFIIYTNQNYGRLTSINIIPEDISETADSFDKLRIDKIAVVREDNDGFSTVWEADVNDWISIDYHDEGERTSTTGQSGRTEAELSTPYLISNEGYSMNLLFAIHTDSYTNTPFEGTVEGVVEYIDCNGSIKTETFNMVESIYRFSNKAYTTANYTLAGKAVSAAVIDRSWMLFQNHTDRFKVSIDDVAELVRLKLTISSDTSGYWKVSGVNVYQIKGDGKLVLNSDSEYVTTAELSPITSSTAEEPYEQWYPANGAAQTLTIEFAKNSIQVDQTKDTWNSVITYEPQSKDDTLNIYAHVKESTYPLDSYEMLAAVNYQIEQVTETDHNGLEKTYADRQKQVSVSLQPDMDSMMFTAIGVKASGITEFNSLTLRTRDELVQYTEIDYAYVEHIRSGVILNTYYLDFQGRNAENTITAEPEQELSNRNGRQELTFMLSDDTETTSLFSKTNDVAVSFTYTTTYDPTGRLYTSRNIFLAENQVSRLKAGEISTVSFSEPYVKDVASITFTAVGTARNTAAVKSAYMVTYSGEDMDNWFSFGTEMNGKMNLSPVTMSCTGSTSESRTVRNASTVADLSFVFYTAEASSMTESGTSTPIRMTVVYYDDMDVVHAVQYEDIHDYLTEGTFHTGGVATVRLLLSGFKEIRYIEVEPYDSTQAYSTATWALKQVACTTLVNDVKPVEIRRGVKQTAQEGTGIKIGMSQIAVRLTANILKEDGSYSDRRVYQSGIEDESATGILISGKQTIQFYPEIIGSLDSVSVSCARVAVTQEGKTVTETDTESLSYVFTDGAISAVIFAPGQEGDYRITVSSLEIGDVQVSVDISVTEAAENTEEETAGGTTEDPEGAAEQQTDESDSTPSSEEQAESAADPAGEDLPAGENNGNDTETEQEVLS